MTKSDNLTRRERQVMDIIYEMGEGTVGEVIKKIPNAPSYSAIRAVLSRMVNNGMLKYHEKGPRYVYSAAVGLKKARQTALKKVIDTFFDGSPLHTINALLGISANKLSREELNKLEKAIIKAKEKEK